MNKTKKLTQGAMMLAILGALILIDRMTAFWFTEFVVLIAPIIIIMYSSMQTIKDGLFLSVGVIIISFLLGSFQVLYLVYIPVGVITGIVYSIGIKKNFNKSTLLILACLVYIVGEVVYTYIVMPIMGISMAQVIEEFRTSFASADAIIGVDYSTVLEAAGLNFDSIIIILYLVTTVLTGVMEGFLIHLLSIFLLKRFKIKDLGRFNMLDIKPNKVVSYVSFLSLFVFVFKDYIQNETVFYIIATISIVGLFVLIYYGYLFITIYGALVMRKNIGLITLLICFLMPALFFVMAIIGFLYGTGPLRDYLQRKINTPPHE